MAFHESSIGNELVFHNYVIDEQDRFAREAVALAVERGITVSDATEILRKPVVTAEAVGPTEAEIEQMIIDAQTQHEITPRIL